MREKNQCLLGISLFLAFCSCQQNLEKPISFEPLTPNVLDFKGIPSTASDRAISSFCDLGAWHSYSLPDDSTYVGGFIGPFSMARGNGTWVGKKFAHLTLYSKTGQKLKYSDRSEVNQFPGWLEQILFVEDKKLEVDLKLFYTSNRTVAIVGELTNRSDEAIEISMEWAGETWLENAVFSAENGLSLVFADATTQHRYQFGDELKIDLGPGNTSYSATSKELITIDPEDPYLTGVTYSVLFEGDDRENITKFNVTLSDLFRKTQSRWTGYLDAFPYSKNHWLDADDFDLLKSKCIQTLIINWKSVAGELKHDGLFPSYHHRGFHGFWAWDSWKHAVALSKFAPELAKSQVLAMFDYQDDLGMIADCIFRDTLIEKHNWRNTKPPLATWAVYEIFQKTGDTTFVKTMFPKLNKYHNWWYENRDHDQNGLCEYGSTDGSRVAAAWESGMDNAVRFDEATIQQNSEKAWSFNQESVDLNAYLTLEKKQLACLAKVIGEEEFGKILQESAIDLGKRILEFYDSDQGYFFDRKIPDNTLISVFGPEGWIPLWTELASEDQAESLRQMLLNDEVFNSKVPLPTLDISHLEFDPSNGYWRGPVWLDQAYFAIAGLESYGFYEVANELKLKLIHNAEGLLEKGVPIRENYHPVTGEGLNAKHFSWSAAHLLLLINDNTNDVSQ